MHYMRTKNIALHRRGMTLIEVSVALVILGTLLVSAVLARGRYLKQSALAERKFAAVAAANALLIQWSNQLWNSSSPLPSATSGSVSGKRKMNWRTQILDREDARQLGAKVLRLQFFDAVDSSPTPSPEADYAPLASVEVLVPASRLEPEHGKSSATGGLNAAP